nr:MAG TPA: hypothetical protein [Caudoviricetes sp.]
MPPYPPRAFTLSLYSLVPAPRSPRMFFNNETHVTHRRSWRHIQNGENKPIAPNPLPRGRERGLRPGLRAWGGVC